VGVDSTGLRLPREQPRVLRQEVLESLRTDILAGGIKPGSRLLEADIAQRMGVSRAPVREAIRQLEQEGLVEFFPHRGAVVVGLPEDEIDAIYELRALIEGKAIERVCLAASAEQIAILDALVWEMQAALTRQDIAEVAELDLRFHRRLVELSGFSLLRHIWTSLDGLVRVRSYQALQLPRRSSAYFLKESVSSHARLVDAIRAGDVALARARIEEHIMEVPARMNEDGTEPADPAGAAGTPNPDSAATLDR
jgi:DNA-binding GntR family transcriptional regulator